MTILCGQLEAKLSKMAVSNAHGEDSPYFAGWKAYEENPYHPVENPTGVIQMGLAENQVSFDLIEKYLEQHPEASIWGSGPASFRENALFQDYHGLYTFKKAMASFMEKIRCGRVKFDPDRIVLTAGATSANELLAFILTDPGDAILVPTPYYPGFDRDLRWRTGATIVPVHGRRADSFQLTLPSLSAAYAAAASSNLRVKALLITNPSNPLGVSASRSLLESILDFTAEKNIHLISDEIYSGSVFSSADFVSVADIISRRPRINADRVHIVYSLSKDLGLPGFRVGALYSYNDRVVKIARRMSSFSLVSSQTQRMLAGMLSDEEFIERYVETNRKRLRERYEWVVEGMKASGIECLEGNAGLFCWVNLGEFVEEKTMEGELKLWKVVVDEVKINISPGCSCHCEEAGWFRVCFANLTSGELVVAMRRLTEFAARIRARRSAVSDMLLQEYVEE